MKTLIYRITSSVLQTIPEWKLEFSWFTPRSHECHGGVGRVLGGEHWYWRETARECDGQKHWCEYGWRFDDKTKLKRSLIWCSCSFSVFLWNPSPLATEKTEEPTTHDVYQWFDFRQGLQCKRLMISELTKNKKQTTSTFDIDKTPSANNKYQGKLLDRTQWYDDDWG